MVTLELIFTSDPEFDVSAAELIFFGVELALSFESVALRNGRLMVRLLFFFGGSALGEEG